MRSGVSLRVLVGGLLIAAGIAVLLLGKFRIPFGRLPGDIAYRGKNFAFYFPVASSIVISIVLSLLFYLIARFRR
jgi:heme/copper-type cytochrome/quinol oxidase subunit 2